MANIEMVWTLSVVLVAVLIGFVVVPKLKAKGWIKDKDVQFTTQLLEIVGLVMADVKFKDDKTKENAVAVLHVAQVAVKYVHDVMGDSVPLADKKKMAVAASLEALMQSGIEATEDRKRIIEVAVDTLLTGAV